ncbi:MAG: pyruvate kinase [Bacteroidales bacterium]
MKIKKARIREMIAKIELIIDSANHLEEQYASHISRVHPDFKRSAVNLVHYMALRKHDINKLQESLRDMGLTPFDHLESHVMRSLLLTRTILQRLIGEVYPVSERKTISVKRSRKILSYNTQSLFGRKAKKRRTRIMVTMPSEAAEEDVVVGRFIKSGMNCARINCAHDNPDIWKRMIDNLQSASARLGKDCRVMMDLGGPKLRTGPMMEGPKVIHIQPKRDDLGNAVKPALLWLAPPAVLPPGEADAMIPVDAAWLKKIKRGDVVHFTDSRDKKCSFEIVRKQGEGKWALCYDSTYITTGTEFILRKENQEAQEMVAVGELLPLEQFIVLKPGDNLILHKDQRPGEPAVYDQQGKLSAPAHIACTMHEIFDDVKPGEPILFDDGRIEGVIQEVKENEIVVKVVNAKETGTKLRAEKGINLPLTELSFSGLTEKDREDLEFVVQHAHGVNMSFVNDVDDVKGLLAEFEKLGREVGVILKIETRKGYRNLPLILLEAMRVHPVGVMIARGDLAVEIGWDNMALVQEEILRVCEAAHIPDIWATQVLENLAKKGIPSRAEITDAGMSQRAECVMLNKGAQISKAIKMLNKILRSMQEVSKKKESVLPQLTLADELLLYNREIEENYG